MPRPRKDGVNLNLKIDKQIYDDLNDFSTDSGQTKTFIVEKALKEYMTKYERMKDMLKEDND